MRIPSAREPIEWQSTYPSDGRDQVRGIARQRRLPHHVPRTAPPLAGEHRTRVATHPLTATVLALSNATRSRPDAQRRTKHSLRPAACALPRRTSYNFVRVFHGATGRAPYQKGTVRLLTLRTPLLWPPVRAHGTSISRPAEWSFQRHWHDLHCSAKLSG